MTGSPMSEMRANLISILEAEFATEGIKFADDKLHASLGTEGPVGAVYPEDEPEHAGVVVAQDLRATIQLFNRWDKQINPKQSVSPTVIEGYAYRLKRAIRNATEATGTSKVWSLRVTSVVYPDDPTGNKTRLVAGVVGIGQNPATTNTLP